MITKIKQIRALIPIIILLVSASSVVFALTYNSTNYTMKNARIVVSGGKATSTSYSLNEAAVGNAVGGKIESANYSLDATNIDKKMPLNPPNQPTVNPVTTPANNPIQTLSGTKDAGTSIYINGYLAVPLDNQTIWSYDYTLSPGNNDLVITSRDKYGQESPSVHVSIFLEIIPPAITDIQPPNGSISYAQNNINFSVTAQDAAGGSSLLYQFSVDTVIKQSWSANNIFSWNTTESDFGVHTIKIEVKDTSGAEVSQDITLCLFRKPPAPPLP